MPQSFRMPDGSFVVANNYAEANRLWKTRSAPRGGPAAQPQLAPVAVTFKATVKPEDDFAGRSATKFGVGERVDLGFTTNPVRTAASFGGLIWVVRSGPATMNNQGNTGTGRLTMGDRSGAVVIELRTVGAAPEVKVVKTFWVVEPESSKMDSEPGTGVYHRKGYACAGFWGIAFMRPTDVSFYRCEWREGSATPVATGSLAVNVAVAAATSAASAQHLAVQSEIGELKKARHPVMGTWHGIGRGNSVKGCQVNMHDDVNSIDVQPPFKPGSFEWPIPWLWRLVGGSSEKVYFKATHSEVVDAMGRFTISKAGYSVTTNAADPTSAK